MCVQKHQHPESHNRKLVQLRSFNCPRYIRLGPRLGYTGQTRVEQLRWRGYCNSRSDRKGPLWPVGQLPSTHAATLGQKLLSSF